MKILKWFVALLGLVAIAIAGFFFFRSWEDVRALMFAANANHAGFASPWPVVWKSFVFMGLGGFLLGLAAGLPLWTRGGLRKKVIMETHGLDEDGKPLRAPEKDLSSANAQS